MSVLKKCSFVLLALTFLSFGVTEPAIAEDTAPSGEPSLLGVGQIMGATGVVVGVAGADITLQNVKLRNARMTANLLGAMHQIVDEEMTWDTDDPVTPRQLAVMGLVVTPLNQPMPLINRPTDEFLDEKGEMQEFKVADESAVATAIWSNIVPREEIREAVKKIQAVKPDDRADVLEILSELTVLSEAEPDDRLINLQKYIAEVKAAKNYTSYAIRTRFTEITEKDVEQADFTLKINDKIMEQIFVEKPKKVLKLLAWLPSIAYAGESTKNDIFRDIAVGLNKSISFASAVKSKHFELEKFVKVYRQVRQEFIEAKHSVIQAEGPYVAARNAYISATAVLTNAEIPQDNSSSIMRRMRIMDFNKTQSNYTPDACEHPLLQC